MSAIPGTMRAALLREFGALDVAEVPMPVPGHGEVLVRVRACGICGTDLKIVGGAYRGTWPPELPFIIGHEWSGEVAALGPGTGHSGLAVGDRVVGENHTGCGACPRCRTGRSTCASGCVSPASSSTGTPPPRPWPSTRYGPRSRCTRSPGASATWPPRWSTRAR